MTWHGRRVTVYTYARPTDMRKEFDGLCALVTKGLHHNPLDAERITTVKLTYQVEHHVRQKYRCACNGAVVTAPGPAQVIPGGRHAREFGMGVAVAKYTDHLPLAARSDAATAV